MIFDTTRWSLVVAAGSDNSAAARAALSALCDAYWYPLYAYVRHRGVPADDARDLTQAFLTSLIDRQDLKHVSQGRGAFRSFLLASLQHFLANDAARQRAANWANTSWWPASMRRMPSLGLFHERLGFVRVAHFREVGFKFNRWLDLVFLQRML